MKSATRYAPVFPMVMAVVILALKVGKEATEAMVVVSSFFLLALLQALALLMRRVVR